ncbi:MAG: Tim44/TimA family putative adaptor protein [Pseudomonadota bacterium]
MSSDMIEILVLIAIAGVVLFRLKSVIGTRTGHEGPPDYVRRQQEAAQDEDARPGPVAVPDLPDEDDAPSFESVPEDSRSALEAILRIEPDFDIDGFVDGGRSAYEMILMAYEEGDRDTLQNLLAPDVFQAFQTGIVAREEAGLRVDARFIGVKDARVEEIQFDPDAKIADVSVRFVGELITAVRDAENRVVEGDPNEVRRQTDVWTFSREMGSVDPNWLLTGTGD